MEDLEQHIEEEHSDAIKASASDASAKDGSVTDKEYVKCDVRSDEKATSPDVSASFVIAKFITDEIFDNLPFT
jgi:hypothetical protein